ncbi:S8 family serine peptidase [Sediminitomix flava]|uniref:Putative secreted protein (Por secretion system target) n=1 Tax=Sediminitomix flava TaxID=379075 RepID=A0A315ZCB9_SEDFL|nr:S8 family serine peptidase [Sediminitomix flava]PWJ42743.1 putative secreted protein (Por secretion system target) [Sediminitomix flava]
MITRQTTFLIRKILLLSILSFVGVLQSFAQNQQTKKQRILKKLSIDFASAEQINYDKAVKYAEANGYPLTIERPDGNLYLQSITDENELVYIKSYNRASAATSGAAGINPGGSMGLGLTGEGLTVGVWEVGDPLLTHDELVGRAFKMDSPSSRRNANEQNHASHVTGTIIAGGVRSNAKGMAYKAKAHNYSSQNDLAEMANAAQNNLIISNHSYGSVRGWDGDQWFGNKNVSTQEDYLFGFYSSTSSNLDAVAYSAPNYLIVWAAGNDRTDAPSSSSTETDVTVRQDGPYDCIGPSGIAKNILTVGAVESVSEYTGPSSVIMSEFSSWGPADDGRIKPDLVGAGVEVFSSGSGASKSNPDDGVNESSSYYLTLSGTSMASPSVAGTLLLLQELYKDLNNGQQMRSSTLKALAIHSCREVGDSDGPDYKHGWGLINAEGASNVLLLEASDRGHQVIESELSNQGTYTLDVTSDGQNPIVVTLVWTDPAGAVPSASVDPSQKALVNDLDLRVKGSDDTVYYPWKLNPSTPSAAATNSDDNDTDNVEKIEIEVPSAGTYTIEITHKGNLVDNEQEFGLIVSTASVESTARTFYWVGLGENESWNDGGNWSLESGGDPANEIPTETDRVVFDDDNFILNSVSLEDDISISTLTFNNTDPFTLNTNEFSINVDGALLAYGPITYNGNLNLTSELIPQNNIIIESDADFSNADVALITSDASKGWKVKSDIFCRSLTISTGLLQLGEYTLETDELSLLSDAEISVDERGSLLLGTSLSADFDGFEFDGLISTKGDLTFDLPNSFIRTLDFSNLITVSSAITLDSLLSSEGGLSFTNPITLTINEHMELRGRENSKVSLSSNGGVSTLSSNADSRYCNDHLDISNIQIEGSTLFVTGDSSTIDSNSSGWTVDDCDNMLYANFDAFFACTNSLISLEDKSTGNPETWSWEVRQNNQVVATVNEQSPQLLFEGDGDIEVVLTITRGSESTSKTKTIELSPNTLTKPNIVVSGNILRVQAQPNADYLWVYNGMVVQESNLNYFVNENLLEGVYQVIVNNGSCRSVSEEFNLTYTSSDSKMNTPILAYPNPIKSSFVIENFTADSGEVSIYNLLGQVVDKLELDKNEIVEFSNIKWQKGFYILVWNTGETVFKQKLVKE